MRASLVKAFLSAVLLQDNVNVGVAPSEGHRRVVDRGHLSRQHRLDLIPWGAPTTGAFCRRADCGGSTASKGLLPTIRSVAGGCHPPLAAGCSSVGTSRSVAGGCQAAAGAGAAAVLGGFAIALGGTPIGDPVGLSCR